MASKDEFEQKCQMTKYVRDLIGKWKPEIIFYMGEGPVRLSELEKKIPEADPRVLKRQLRSLETSGIVKRTRYSEVPPRVEYSLTEEGRCLTQMQDAINKTLSTHQKDCKN
jgi:DNA-binding HxlR family transcriptional regulator